MMIGNFNTLVRQDKGALCENFMIAQRMKILCYENSNEQPYFWHTTQQQQIDYIAGGANVVNAFEIK